MIHGPTIILMIALFAGFFSAVCFFMSATSERTRQAYLSLSLSMGVLSMAFVVANYASTNHAPDSSVFLFLGLIANSMLLFSMTPLKNAFESFSSRKAPSWPVNSLLALGLSTQFIALLNRDSDLRSASASIFVGLLLAMSTSCLFTDAEMRKKPFTKMIVFGSTMVSIALISRVVFFIMDGFEMVPMGSSSGKMVVVLSMIGVGMCTILIGTYLMTNELLREDIARIAEQDSLTGIPNRRALMDRSRKLVEMAAKKRESLMVLMCDIDHFKKINDTFGHAEGDRTIKDVANIVASICSRLDPEKAAIGRYGGEEFCVVTRGMSDSQAEAFSKTLVEMTRRADRRDDRPKVTMSAGAVLFNSASRHSRELLESALKTADDALYRSKREGRDRWTLVVES